MIAVDGKCFKRYLEIARVIGVRTAVITDNDKSYQKNIQDAYTGYMNNEYPKIKVYSDTNDDRYTFEICVYADNKGICDSAFGEHLRIHTVLDYMLANKADCAYKLANSEPDDFVVPGYIQDALKWIDA